MAVREMKVLVSVSTTIPITLLVDDSDDIDARIGDEVEKLDTGELHNLTWDIDDISQESIIH